MKILKMLSGKLTGRAGTFAIGLLAFVVSLYWTFPEQVISARLEQEIARASGGEVTAKVQRAQLWRLSGLHAQNVTVQLGSQPPIRLDTVRLRLRLLPLMLLRLSVYGQVQLEGGTLDVTVTRRGQALDARVDFDAINLAKPEALGRVVGMRLAGQLSGFVDLEGVQDFSHSRGKTELKLTRTALGPGDIKGLSVPQLPLGDLTLTGDVQDGVWAIKGLRQENAKVQLTGGGKVSFGRQLSSSLLDVCFRIGADKDFLADQPKLATLLQLAGSQLKRDADGMLNLPLSGRVGAPEVRPVLCPRR